MRTFIHHFACFAFAYSICISGFVSVIIGCQGRTADEPKNASADDSQIVKRQPGTKNGRPDKTSANEDPASVAYCKAIELDEAGRTEEALQLFTKAHALAPGSLNYWLARSYALIQLKQFADAETLLRSELARDREHFVDGTIALGHMYCQMNQPQKAISILSEAIEREDLSASLFEARGELFSNQGDDRRALKDFKSAFAASGHKPHLFDYLFPTALRQEDYITARDAALAATRTNPPQSEYHAQLALVLACSPNKDVIDPEQALRHALIAVRATRTNEELPFCESVLAAAFAANNSFEDAISHQERAIELLEGSVPMEFHDQLKLYRAGKPFVLRPHSDPVH